MKKVLDGKIFETGVKEQKLAKLERELMKIRNQRRDVCTPASLTENPNTSKISTRSDRSFS